MSKNIFQKIWIELNRVRRIEFISYPTEEEELERINKMNFEIKKLTNYIIDSTYHNDNYLMPESQARLEAIKLYAERKAV